MQQIPPIPPVPSIPAVPQMRVNGVSFGQGPTAVWRGATARREELGRQMDRLQERRNEISGQLQDPMVGGADRRGLEQRISDIDARIQALDKQIAGADAEVANAAGVPGAIVEQPRGREGPPEEVYVLSGMFIVVVLLPISLAFARRIWRRGGAAVAALPGDLMDRITRLDQAVDSIAVEVERIGEGQRFMTRLFADKGTPDALLAASQQRGAAASLSDRNQR
jgi:hypothetical protein